MIQTDAECVKQCLDGHPEAYGRLVQRYQAPLWSYLAGRMAGSERAEEAVQETFVRGFFALGKLRRSGSFFSWLLGIAVRVAREQDRLERRHREVIGRSPLSVSVPAVSNDADLKQAVAELPPPYAEVVLLRYYGGLSCGEVARQLGVPLGTVTKRLSRAYGLLRESLGEAEGGVR